MEDEVVYVSMNGLYIEENVKEQLVIVDVRVNGELLVYYDQFEVIEYVRYFVVI